MNRQLYELWDKFEKSGDPKDYLDYRSALRASESKDAAPSRFDLIKGVPKLP